MSDKEDLHQLVDELPRRELHAARRYLEYLRGLSDPVLRALREAPEDDGVETEKERVAVAEAQDDLAAGYTVPMDKVLDERS